MKSLLLFLVLIAPAQAEEGVLPFVDSEIYKEGKPPGLIAKMLFNPKDLKVNLNKSVEVDIFVEPDFKFEHADNVLRYVNKTGKEPRQPSTKVNPPKGVHARLFLPDTKDAKHYLYLYFRPYKEMTLKELEKELPVFQKDFKVKYFKRKNDE